MMRGGCLGNGGRTLIQFDDVDIGGMFGKNCRTDCRLIGIS